VLATLAMAISLIAAAQLPVISNGLLMGGVFTMLYGVGWVIVSGTSTTRFIVMTLALVITLALGYVRFVRRPRPAETQSAGATAPIGEFVDLEQRVRTLEERMVQAATALGAQG
jgi:membrane protein implicated in regulation of membrane protease activity